MKTNKDLDVFHDLLKAIKPLKGKQLTQEKMDKILKRLCKKHNVTETDALKESIAGYATRMIAYIKGELQ